jgi:hypothetical protein
MSVAVNDVLPRAHVEDPARVERSVIVERDRGDRGRRTAIEWNARQRSERGFAEDDERLRGIDREERAEHELRRCEQHAQDAPSAAGSISTTRAPSNNARWPPGSGASPPMNAAGFAAVNAEPLKPGWISTIEGSVAHSAANARAMEAWSMRVSTTERERRRAHAQRQRSHSVVASVQRCSFS